MNNDKYALIVGGVGILGVCTAVSIACYVTKSALPLLGLIFIPSVRWYSRKDNDDESES